MRIWNGLQEGVAQRLTQDSATITLYYHSYFLRNEVFAEYNSAPHSTPCHPNIADDGEACASASNSGPIQHWRALVF
jgi:hypothetical protein